MEIKDRKRMKSLRYVLEGKDDEDEIGISKEQFENAKSVLYKRPQIPNPSLLNYIDDFVLGPWGYMFPNYHRLEGGIVEDRYLHLTLYHETDEGLARLAGKLGLPAKSEEAAYASGA